MQPQDVALLPCTPVLLTLRPHPPVIPSSSGRSFRVFPLPFRAFYTPPHSRKASLFLLSVTQDAEGKGETRLRLTLLFVPAIRGIRAYSPLPPWFSRSQEIDILFCGHVGKFLRFCDYVAPWPVLPWSRRSLTSSSVGQDRIASVNPASGSDSLEPWRKDYPPRQPHSTFSKQQRATK